MTIEKVTIQFPVTAILFPTLKIEIRLFLWVLRTQFSRRQGLFIGSKGR